MPTLRQFISIPTKIPKRKSHSSTRPQVQTILIWNFKALNTVMHKIVWQEIKGLNHLIKSFISTVTDTDLLDALDVQKLVFWFMHRFCRICYEIFDPQRKTVHKYPQELSKLPEILIQFYSPKWFFIIEFRSELKHRRRINKNEIPVKSSQNCPHTVNTTQSSQNTYIEMHPKQQKRTQTLIHNQWIWRHMTQNYWF